MTSFVNLLASDVWSETDIVNRTEAMIASEFSPNAVAILNRKVTANVVGQRLMTDEENAELARYAQVCVEAASAGDAARDDMSKLTDVMTYESAVSRLKLDAVTTPVSDLPVGEGEPIRSSEVEIDIAERTAAQAIIDAASGELLALFVLRNPVPVVEKTDDLPIAA